MEIVKTDQRKPDQIMHWKQCWVSYRIGSEYSHRFCGCVESLIGHHLICARLSPPPALWIISQLPQKRLRVLA